MATGDKVLAALEKYGLKQEKPGAWRCNSPLRPGANSHSFTLLINTDMEHGAYFDHRSNERGSLYALAEQLGIDVPRQQATETKRVYTGLDDYAAAHGVSGDVYRAAGWKETAYYDHEHQRERPALEIPTAGGARYRFLDGLKPSYRSPSGYKNCWYGLSRAVKQAAETGQPVVLCNGAASVVVAQHYGVAAAALAGGGQRIPDALLDEFRLAWSGDVVIAMDCDAEGKVATQNYSQQLPTAKIVDLALTAGGDLADFCRLYADASAATLSGRAVTIAVVQERQDAAALADTLKAIEKARKGEKPDATLPELLDIAQAEINHLREKTLAAPRISLEECVDLAHKRLNERMKNPVDIIGLRSHLPTLDKIIGGWRGGAVHVIYGDTNIGKSTLAASIVGLGFMRAGGGLIVPTEVSAGNYIDKLASAMANVTYDKIETGHITPEEYARVETAYARLEATKAHILDAGSPTPAEIAAAARHGVEKHGYKWILVDSFSRVKVPGQTSIYDTTRAAADELQTLARELDVPLLVTVQIGRNQKDRAVKRPQLWDALGGGTIEQNADYVLGLYRHDYYVKLGELDEDPELPDGTALLTCLKGRQRSATGKAVKLVFSGAGFYECESSR